MPTPRYLIGALLFAVAVAIQTRNIFIYSAMFEKVNLKLPADRRFSKIGPSWNRGRVIKLYKAFYPESNNVRRLYMWWYLQMLAFVLSIACVVRFKR